MKKPLEIMLGLIRIPLDYLLTIAAFLIAYHLRLATDLLPGIKLPVTPSVFPEFSHYFVLSSITSLVLIGILACLGLYSFKRPAPFNQQLSKIFIGSLIWLFAIISYYFLIRNFPFSRLAILQTWLLTFLFTSTGRFILQKIQHNLYRQGIAQTRVLLIGATKTAEELLENYFHNPQYLCVGYLDIKNFDLAKLTYLGSITDLQTIVSQQKIDKIIQTKENFPEQLEINILDFCRENHLEYSFIPSQLEMQASNVEIECFEGIPLISLKPTPLDGWGRVAKRLFDFFGSLFLILLLWPLMLLISFIIKLNDYKSTVIFKFLDDGSLVKRVGQKGKLFNFMKFRTMIPNSHHMRYNELLKNNTRGENWNSDSPLIKIKNDPRITAPGRFLRKTSLDELPQLFNVLRGEMSLVGPRPHLPEEVAKYQKHHKFVLTIKPGITGIAQTSGRSDLDFEKEVKLDTYYIENWSLFLDIKILLKTVLVVFKKYEE